MKKILLSVATIAALTVSVNAGAFFGNDLNEIDLMLGDGGFYDHPMGNVIGDAMSALSGGSYGHPLIGGSSVTEVNVHVGKAGEYGQDDSIHNAAAQLSAAATGIYTDASKQSWTVALPTPPAPRKYPKTPSISGGGGGDYHTDFDRDGNYVGYNMGLKQEGNSGGVGMSGGITGFGI